MRFLNVYINDHIYERCFAYMTLFMLMFLSTLFEINL